MKKYEGLFLDHAVRRYCLTDQELEYYHVDNPVFLKYNNRKKVVAERLKNYTKNVISLGHDCMSNTISVRWCLSKNFMQGKLSCPFDLQVTPISALKQIIQCNFSNFYTDSFGFYKDSGVDCFFNKKSGIVYNHDYPDKSLSAKENIEKFNLVLTARANNFRQSVTRAPALFVLHEKSRKPSYRTEIEELAELLKKLYPDSSLVVINEIDSLDDAIPNDGNILNIVPPNPKYVWYKNFLTDEGFEFEKEIVDFLSYWITRTALSTNDEVFIDEKRDYKFYAKAALWLTNFSFKDSIDLIDKSYLQAQHTKNKEIDVVLDLILNKALDAENTQMKGIFDKNVHCVRNYLVEKYLEEKSLTAKQSDNIKQLNKNNCKMSEKIVNLKKQLSYRLGSVLVNLTKSSNLIDYMKIPFALVSEYKKFKDDKIKRK